MKYHTSIIIDAPADSLVKAIMPELNKNWERAKARFELNPNKLLIIIDARDAAALRASVNAVLQMLSVYERASVLK